MPALPAAPARPLCGTQGYLFCEDRARCYFECPHCALITADPAAHLTVGAERAIYGLHQNTPEDAGYRTFLSRLAAPLLMRLQPGMQGLDSGCGPGPVLSMLLREAGMAMTDDAPFIECARIAAAIRLCCLHVVEHFRDPHAGWAQMMARVRPGAGLG